MLVECLHCAAPLDVKVGKSVYKCNYCGRKNVPAQMRTLAQVTPTQWVPPKVWTPPAHMATAGQSLKYSRTISMLTMLPILVGVFVPLIGVFAATGGGSALQVAMWDEESTLECGPNGEIEIEGVDAKVKRGPVIEMTGNCTVTLINSTISGSIGIKGGGNARINIEDSTIEADDVAIDGKGNAQIKVIGKSKIQSKGTGIEGGANAKIEIDGATVSGDEIGIDSGANGKITVRGGGKIEGDETALLLGSNGDVDIRKGHVVSAKGTAIQGGINNEVKCSSGSIKGKTALVVQTNADLRISKCKIKGKQEHGRNAKTR